MKTHKRLNNTLIVVTYIIVLTLFHYSYASAATNAINWQQWSADVFHQAKKENKLVLLNLEAVWCHWCHVMDKKTYSEKNVISKLEKNYIAVKVDHDANPGLANQYRDYGWPATIIFDANGNEIVKRAGYIEADNMARLLTVVLEDPSPENIKSALLSQSKSLLKKDSVSLSDELRSDLIQRHRSAYDEVKGGLKLNQKFLDRDSVEYSMSLAQRGNSAEARRAKHSLTAALNLLDPEWGGFYQYSTQGDWQHAHYEKIMRVQASYLRLYALAYAQFSDANYLHATDEIRRYLNRFLKADSGVYFVSQDADLIQGEHSDAYFALSSSERLATGIPKVDKHVYAQENGWVIEALATVYETSNNKSALDDAITAAKEILKHHYNSSSSGFAHDTEHEDAEPEPGQSTYHLGDNLAMARAFLQLYRVTADRKWLTLSASTSDFIQQHFYSPAGGYTSNEDRDIPVKPVPDIDENISLARFANLLFHYTGNAEYKEMSEHAMHFLGREDIATARLTEAGILLIDKELATDPIHITVIGDKKDAVAEDLFIAALNKTSWYKRVEWWDRKEGGLPNADVAYPVLNRSAAFLCTDNLCSLPVFTAEALNELINRIDEETILTSERQTENLKAEKVSSTIYPQTDNFIYFHSELTNYLSVVF